MEEILKILEKDARTTPEQIATMTGKQVAEVKEVIAKAEREGIIIGYRTMINWAKVGEEQVRALIEVNVVPQRNVGFDSVAERIYAEPDETRIFPGHDVGVKPQSTIRHERETNPFLLRPDVDSFIDLKRNWAAYKKEHGIE